MTAIDVMAVLPAEVRGAFPWLEDASEADMSIVTSQLGKRYQGDILVSRRCAHGAPAVVLTLPLEGTGGPVPPMLWLTCPRASSMVGRLESTGRMEELRERLAGDECAAAVFLEGEERFAVLQEELALAVGGEALARRFASRGVAGGRVGAIKCLHAHLACTLSLGPEAGAMDGAPDRHGARALAGEWCLEMLEEEGGVWCESPPEACVT